MRGSMTESVDSYAYWLRKAKDVRDISEQVADQKMNNILEDIARRYERIAEYALSASGSADTDR
jgi:hypothetical protein